MSDARSELGYFLNLGYADRALSVARHVVGFRNRVWLSRLWFVGHIGGFLWFGVAAAVIAAAYVVLSTV